ncbi:MAG: efflux RND transporter periplasmic adaptor subunit [Bacteroidales bacterium]|nr:MAG: efflux RND transporter periplasmic adaptor subunit [Bacteroidales bacterium]
MNRNRNLILALIIPAGILFSGCNQSPDTKSREEGTGTSSERIQPVRVMKIDYAEIARAEELTATILPFEETHLAPALQGRIRSITVDVNDRVREGEVLVEMDRTQYNQTKVQYQTLKKDLARMDTLLQYGSITQQVYDQQQSAVEMQEVVLNNLEENTRLKAPYSGIITGRYYNEGELFSPTPNTPSGKPAIITLMKIDRLKVYVSLPEEYLPQVKRGLPAILNTDVYPEKDFPGSLFRIYPTIDATTKTFRVELHIPNGEELLRPGMFARIHLILGKRKALVVPAITVLQQPGTNDKYIFINNDGVAQRVFVRIGERFDEQLEIISGQLKGGEELIFAGQNRLEDRDSLRIVTQ